MARRQRREAHELLEARSFKRLFEEHLRGKLSCALNAHTYSELPPFARHAETGEPLPGMFEATDRLAQWFDVRIGRIDHKRVAESFWRMRGEYRALQAENLPHPPYHHTEFLLPLTNEAPGTPETSTLIVCFAPSASPAIRQELAYAHAYPTNVLVHHPKGHVSFAGTADERAALATWVMAAQARRREALLAMTFLHMLAGNDGRSARTVFHAFPWLRGICEAFGIPRAKLDEASLPWRGHDNEFYETISYAKPTAKGESYMPADPVNIYRYMAKLGEGAIQGILTRMALAVQVYDRGRTRPKKPTMLLMFGHPLNRYTHMDAERDRPSMCGAVPAWVARYAEPMRGFGDKVLADFPDDVAEHFKAAINHGLAYPDS